LDFAYFRAEYDKLSLASQPICNHNMLSRRNQNTQMIASRADFAKGIDIWGGMWQGYTGLCRHITPLRFNCAVPIVGMTLSA
jgi:hypothetical protein